MISLENIFDRLQQPDTLNSLKEDIQNYKDAIKGENKPAISKATRTLDKHFWKILEDLLTQKLKENKLIFDKNEQLLVNFGILDFNMVQLEDESEEYRQKIEKRFPKYLMVKEQKEDHIFYLNEWIASWELNANLQIEADQKEYEKEHDFIDDEKAKKYTVIRTNIYKKFLPTLKKLPGMNDNLLKNLLRGDWDRNVEISLVKKKLAKVALSIPEQRLISMHKTMLAQLSSTVQNDEDKKLVALLNKIGEAFIQRRLGMDSIEEKPENNLSNEEQKIHFMLNEIKLLKNLLPIGGIEGKEFITSPILREVKNVCHKDFVRKILIKVREADPQIPEELPIVIVPYKGSGFFEWDHNALVIPVTPSLAHEDVIIRACANYRILTDNLEHRGELKRQYERTLEKGSFKERFIQDYINWVKKVTLGQRRIMSNKKFDFFMKFIGPKQEALFASKEIMAMTNPQLRKKTQEILAQTSSISQNDYFDLATSFWRLGNVMNARKYMELAMTAGMPNAKVILSMGLIELHLKDKIASSKNFKSVLKYFKESIYASYAIRALE